MAFSFFSAISEGTHKHFPKKPGEFLLRPYVDTSEIFDEILYTLYYPSSALGHAINCAALVAPLGIFITVCSLSNKGNKAIDTFKDGLKLTGISLGRAVVFSAASLVSVAYHLLAFATRLISTVVRFGARRKDWPESQLYEDKLPNPTSAISFSK